MARKRKSLYTVKQATAIAFESMDETFLSILLVSLTRALLARPACMDGTILRRLRELRNEKPEKYGYEVVDQESSKYRKKALK